MSRVDLFNHSVIVFLNNVGKLVEETCDKLQNIPAN